MTAQQWKQLEDELWQMTILDENDVEEVMQCIGKVLGKPVFPPEVIRMEEEKVIFV